MRNLDYIFSIVVIAFIAFLFTTLDESKLDQPEVQIFGGMYRIDCDTIVNWYPDGTEVKEYYPYPGDLHGPCPDWVNQYGTKPLIGPKKAKIGVCKWNMQSHIKPDIRSTDKEFFSSNP